MFQVGHRPKHNISWNEWSLPADMLKWLSQLPWAKPFVYSVGYSSLFLIALRLWGNQHPAIAAPVMWTRTERKAQSRTMTTVVIPYSDGGSRFCRAELWTQSLEMLSLRHSKALRSTLHVLTVALHQLHWSHHNFISSHFQIIMNTIIVIWSPVSLDCGWCGPLCLLVSIIQ